jgi:hypothetical protein
MPRVAASRGTHTETRTRQPSWVSAAELREPARTVHPRDSNRLAGGDLRGRPVALRRLGRRAPSGMGQIADNVGRKLLHHEFEASCGDARPDGSCPVFVARHGRDVITAEVTIEGAVLRASYTTTDRTLDDDDVLRIFVLAYLERFTCHFYQPTVNTIELRNSTTGARRTTSYPDRAWLEPEWNS